MEVKEPEGAKKEAYVSLQNLSALLANFYSLSKEPQTPTSNRQELQLKYVAENALQHIKYLKDYGLDELEDYLGQLWDK